MSKKKRNKKYIITAEQQFDAVKPKFNGFTGYMVFTVTRNIIEKK